MAKEENGMKTMKCRQLGGACDLEFQANTFEEMAERSKQHGMEMHQKQDAAHLAAMQEMQALMKNPEDMTSWFESKRKEFEALPESQSM
jgi:predicted small metal-binding protein